MGRKPCCEKVGLKKGPWSEEEDKKLVAYVQEHGHGNWGSIPVKAGLQRCGKSCRLRWINYLKPDIKRGNFSLEEDRTIIQLHALLGNKWSIIAGHLHKRTDNEIKNYWHSHLKKRLIKMGIDPITHKPKAIDQSKDAAIMSHIAQWENTRLEAEARESMLQVGMGSCTSFSHQTRLVISKISPHPSPPPCLDVLKAWKISQNSPETCAPLSNKHNKNTMYNMYAIMLAPNNDLESPQSTLSFPERKLPVSSTMSYEGDGNIIETNSKEKITEGNVSSLQGDDDIMVAVEAFKAARFENIPELSNGEVEGLNIDVQKSISYERFEEEYGYGNNCNFDTNFSGCWNSELNLDNGSPSYSPLFLT